MIYFGLVEIAELLEISAPYLHGLIKMDHLSVSRDRTGRYYLPGESLLALRKELEQYREKKKEVRKARREARQKERQGKR